MVWANDVIKGSHDLRPELIQYWLTRMLPTLHVPGVSLKFKSLICHVLGHIKVSSLPCMHAYVKKVCN
jgi:hypothetical protein